ncbi:MAG: EVE domain-containing protein [Leptolyngbya sp. PLA3]|nr:MAG: EVE domain-containing protein [Cyanobacteria bacterium CYA]MCE7967837.1 EVE domain-containing protein [Leptolyngbya sp. PL-A3]
MATFLVKTEPDCYSFADLLRDASTAWTGVSNAAAQKHMRSMKTGDECLFYHTGNEKRIVGLARVVRGAYPDPDQPGLTATGEVKFVLVDLEPVKASTRGDATLKIIKADPRFAEFDLVRQSRLGVMPVPPKLDKELRKLAGL